MNRAHWSAYSEAELAQLRAGGRVHASRRGHGPAAVAQPPNVTAEAQAVLAGLRHPVVDTGPAYPAHWLPEIKATQTPADWMEDNGPDPHAHRNGTTPANVPADSAYPPEWLQGFGGLGSGALGGDGFLNRRDAS